MVASQTVIGQAVEIKGTYVYQCNLLTVYRHLNGAQLYIHYFPKPHWDLLKNVCSWITAARGVDKQSRGSRNIEIFETKLHWSA